MPSGRRQDDEDQTLLFVGCVVVGSVLVGYALGWYAATGLMLLAIATRCRI